MAVSVREVAALAGVSLGTVSNVLNRPDKVAPATVERVQRAIDQLGFVRKDSLDSHASEGLHWRHSGAPSHGPSRPCGTSRRRPLAPTERPSGASHDHDR